MIKTTAGYGSSQKDTPREGARTGSGAGGTPLGRSSAVTSLATGSVASCGRSCPFPEELRVLARGVLGGRSPTEAEDLLGDFLLRLVEATRHNRAGSAVALLKLSDAGIRAAVKHRLRQVLAETCPGARLRKQLRAMVKAVLNQDLTVLPASAPTSLYRGDRLSTALVRDAVAWVLAQDERPPRTVRDIAAHLQALYFEGKCVAAEPAQPSFEGDLLNELDGARVAHDLQHHLGEDLARVIALRAGGAELRAIAEDQRVAVSTAHQRVASAVERLRQRARHWELEPTVMEPALRALI